MTYRANLIPTLDQLASGELEPTSKTFKGAVAAYRTAAWQGIAFALVNQLMLIMGIAGPSTPTTFIGVAGQAAFFALIQTTWSSYYIRRHRRPSVDQIEHLTRMIEEDPRLARKVTALKERDFTFYRLQQFILKNSTVTNEARLEDALEDMDAAIAGHSR